MNWTIQTFSDAQLLAAAELARRMEWYDRAIATAERTRELHDFELRFLAPYRELAQQARAKTRSTRPGFGLMRQESRFINVARSNVGASGLMQVMPSTARWIAATSRSQRLPSERDAGSRQEYPVRRVLPEARADHTGWFPCAGHRRLQCRPWARAALARHPADGSRGLHRIDSVRRNPRLRQEGDEQCHVLRCAFRAAFGAAERPARHRARPQTAVAASAEAEAALELNRRTIRISIALYTEETFP